jgi:CTP-dependent riboflavin kinase
MLYAGQVIRIRGTVERGCGHFRCRITDHPEAFREATGESLYAGTLNVNVGAEVPIQEHFRIKDPADPSQNLLFEVCRVNGLWAYRIQPCHILTKEGGHGDGTIEIACAKEIPQAGPGSTVEIDFFR